MSNRVTLSVQNHIADVRLNRPDKMNALDEPMIQSIIETGKAIEADTAIRCVVLSGEGRAFCAGIDLSNFNPENAQAVLQQSLATRTHGIANKWQAVAWLWRELSVPVIAAVHGVSFGAGLQIMSGADIKFIHPDTRLSIMEMKWGLFPDMAGTQLWRHNIREDILRELIYTHREFSGTQAVEYGFATHLTPNPHQAAMQLAEEIASKSPSAIVKAKKVLNQAPYLDPTTGLLLESTEQDAIKLTPNQLEAVFASLQKRSGNFEDYR